MNDLHKKLKNIRNLLAYDIGEFEFESDADGLARHVLSVIDVLAEHFKEDEPDTFTGFCIQKYESSSGNITWKVQDKDNNPVWLRQAHKEMLEAAGVWHTLNSLDMDTWYDDCTIVIEVVPDGDFKKPVKVVSFHIPILPRTIEPQYPERYSEELINFLEVVRGGDYVVLDTETANFFKHGKVSYGEICEIAIIDASGTYLLDTLVKPSNGIDSGAAAVHGITDAMVAHAPCWQDVREKVAAIITNRNVIIYNSAFDMECLKYTESVSKVEVPTAYNILPSSIHCAMTHFAEFNNVWNAKHGNYRWLSLTDAAAKQGVTVANAHRALGDCIMTNAVIKSMIEHD